MIKRIGFFIPIFVLICGCNPLTRVKETKMMETGRGNIQVGSKRGEATERGFILGVGDEVKITVWKHDDLDRVLRIDPAGKIFYPLVGEVQAAGLSTNELRDIITRGLAGYIVDPQVNIEMQVFRSQKVYVLGEVRQPAVLPFHDPMHVLDALLLAGGFTREADEKKVILIRSYPEMMELNFVNIMDLLKKADMKQLFVLQKDDIVYVPPSFIANVDRFFQHLNTIFAPIIGIEKSIVLGDEIYRIMQGLPPRRIYAY
jgi:polysaccharide export outer membrane protein